MTLAVRAPLAGTAVALDSVPDPVFSARLVGPGTALDPERGPQADVLVRAPVTGTLAKALPHAFVVVAEDERTVLVHLGLDTVTLEGRCFTTHAQEGARVEAGDPVVSWRPAEVEAAGLSPVVAVIALDGAEEDLTLPAEGTDLRAGQTLFTWG
ncbi:PTS sugar transporter subunit IIA [Actinomyces howellii]|uniref:Glucose-specific phosphotransferase enzyme IIA component n=1 Tax=Actinomyces howellii TaxID=52771 RepID=A0A448HFH8_9ACTO|nr:PTS glucose transporter subunit IIA [Actinomyces howellii]VEG27104.1 Glucose-specific phosphotransferase enzyme IIA component [Actinomyces howellii]